MAPLDTISLPDLSDDAPAGENLELHADFGALERAAQGRPETQYGKTIEPAVPPDWKEAAALAESLLERTRDLRVMTHLAIARLHLTGLPAFAEGLTLIRTQLQTRWEQVHPQLDPEDDLDPMLRSNALLRLQDASNVLRPLRDLPLAGSRRTGAVSWRDIAIFNGAMEPEPGKEKLTETAIRAIFAGSDPAVMQTLRAAVDVAVDEAAAIPTVFEQHAGTGTGPNFTDLSKLLRDIQKELRRFDKSAEAAAPAEPDATDAAEGAAPDPASSAQPRALRGAATVQGITDVSKREDALYAMDLAATYFRRYEPSSPLPLLIDRAKRLAAMEFMDILRDLAPDGVGQAQIIAGNVQRDGDGSDGV